MTVGVVSDGALGLLGILSAKQMSTISDCPHQSPQKLAREFHATGIVTERGDKGAGESES
jgi:hypothetical protein